MAEQTVKAADNPNLVNNLVRGLEATQETTSIEAEIVSPSDTLVNLPSGYITPDGEVIKTAEVRELTGKDEEFIAKSGTVAKAFTTILNRATVKIGNTDASERILDDLLGGDRDALMVGIYKATFGSVAEIGAYCNGCGEVKPVSVDVDRDIKTKVLVDPMEDRYFTVQGKSSEFLVTLPTGFAQRELNANADKTYAELQTILLEKCVVEIDQRPVLSKLQIQNLGLQDRRKITEEISNRNPGPQFENISVTCPDCEGEVVVPINLGTLFRL
jgi:hypothetical protein